MPLEGEYEPSTRISARDQAELYERTAGAEGNTLDGKPVIVLTSVGAKTGKIRKTPLIRIEHNGAYALVASMGGAAEHPAWYHNAVAHPHVELQDGAVKKDCVARVIDGTEREEWWLRAVEAFPQLTDYQAKTDRVIPVFLLSAID